MQCGSAHELAEVGSPAGYLAHPHPTPTPPYSIPSYPHQNPSWAVSTFTAASHNFVQVYMLGGSVTAGIGRGTDKAYTEHFFDIINASFPHP